MFLNKTDDTLIIFIGNFFNIHYDLPLFKQVNLQILFRIFFLSNLILDRFVLFLVQSIFSTSFAAHANHMIDPA